MKLAVGQMLVMPGQPEANLARATAQIRDAAEQGCDLVALPECLDLGWGHASATALAQPIPGARSQALCAAARAAGVHLAAGLTERDGDQVFNAAVLISPAGEIVLHHRKIHEVDFARRLYATGRRLSVAETDLGVIGLTICADNLPSSLALGHSLGLMGAELLLSPSAWAVRPDHDNTRDPYGGGWESSYRELAQTHGMPVIGVSNVGPVIGGEWDGWRCIGASRVVDARGSVCAVGPYGVDAATLLTVDL